MKKLTKIITACIAASLFVLSSVFSSFAAVDPQIESFLADTARQKIESFYVLEDSELDQNIQYCEQYGDTFSADVFRSVKDMKAQYGAFLSTGDAVISENTDGTINVTIPVKMERGTCSAVMVVSEDLSYFTELKFESQPTEAKQTVGSLMKEAGVNLVVGMGTVFAVLIFLCWVISLFKYIHAAEEKISKKNAKPAAACSPEVTVTKVTASPSSDEEIQAVIAAAIAAYESESEGSIIKQGALANGKNIRSYRR